ncbi:MAG TPA: alpha/beta hydrolase [Candidatus Dormibacteraeota bacterium]|nr:alpha/beta hydrolase [Candidatus Dormibacteraeota bacterium]
MSSSVATKIETLKVPGANLYYEVRGSGPVLLMMPGGPADATAFRSIAGQLDPHYTVVTYDPRGLSRSRLEGPLDEERIIEVFADDVHRLLAAVTKEKADVFASSGGAVIALELAARHPEQLKTVVAHEPPAPTLQPDPAHVRAVMEEITATYFTGGIGPAVRIFSDMTRSGPPPAPEGEPTPEMLEDMARMQGNMDLFFGPYVLGIARYEPDFAALKAASCRIVGAVGNESRGEMAHDGGLALASRMGTQAVVFPGDHGGFGSHAADFAIKLREVLEQ